MTRLHKQNKRSLGWFSRTSSLFLGLLPTNNFCEAFLSFCMELHCWFIDFAEIRNRKSEAHFSP